jgi:dihydrofolate reductase
MSTDAPIPAPQVELVVAVARNGVIGRGNALPWRLPADLAHFKRTTLGHPILMGRRTWESIGRPLPGRTNLVLTRDPGFAAPGAGVVHSVEAALALAGPGPLMVIGGAELYRACLPRAGVLHLTTVEADVEGDVHFPQWHRSDWRETWREAHDADERNELPYTFLRFERVRPQA